MVCGPIGNKGIERIKNVSQFLVKNGFSVVDQFCSRDRDYSRIRDFAGKKKLSNAIVRHDLGLVSKSDVLVVLATPSFGAAMEMYFAKELGKRTVFFSEGKIPSPWPVKYADYIARDGKSLLKILEKIRNEGKSHRHGNRGVGMS